VVQLFKLESVLWTSFKKYLVLTVALVEEAHVEDEAEIADELLGSEITLELISLSSSVIVSIIFDALRLITETYCGGATSMKNLAIREFAILNVNKFQVFNCEKIFNCLKTFCIEDVFEE